MSATPSYADGGAPAAGVEVIKQAISVVRWTHRIQYATSLDGAIAKHAPGTDSWVCPTYNLYVSPNLNGNPATYAVAHVPSSAGYNVNPVCGTVAGPLSCTYVWDIPNIPPGSYYAWLMPACPSGGWPPISPPEASWRYQFSVAPNTVSYPSTSVAGWKVSKGFWREWMRGCGNIDDTWFADTQIGIARCLAQPAGCDCTLGPTPSAPLQPGPGGEPLYNYFTWGG